MVHLYKFGENFPNIYLNQYCMSVDDYKDKTLLAILYAVEHGYPLKDLTRYQRAKIKKLFEGGYKARFYQKYANHVLQQTIYFYFMKNNKINWDRRVCK